MAALGEPREEEDFSARRRLWKLVPILGTTTALTAAELLRQEDRRATAAAAECKSAASQARSDWSAGTAREARWPARSDGWYVGLGLHMVAPPHSLGTLAHCHG